MAADAATPPRVLIVDDHPDNVEVLRARLEAMGYRTACAGDGEEALDKVHASPPDLILLDVMMPRLDGNEVARRIKADKNLPFIPIIMQTALDSVESKVEGLRRRRLHHQADQLRRIAGARARHAAYQVAPG